MMLYKGQFVLERQFLEDKEMYYIPATESYSTEGYSFDKMPILEISTLKKFRSEFLRDWIFSGFCMLISWAFLVYAFVTTLGKYFTGYLHWYSFVTVAVAFPLSFLYTRQFVRSRVYDLDGGWINLWNGSTNIEGGCVIKRK